MTFGAKADTRQWTGSRSIPSLLGLFTIYRGERNEREKPNDVCVGFSRDGFHWARPARGAFIGDLLSRVTIRG